RSPDVIRSETHVGLMSKSARRTRGCWCPNTARVRGNNTLPALAKAPKDSRSGGSPTRARTAASASRSSPRTRSPCSSRTLPASVSLTPVRPRSTRRTPTSRSSLVSCWDKAGGVKERRSAAAVIEPAWAISTSTRNRWASSTYLSPLVRRTHLGPKLCLRIFSRHNFMLTAGPGRVESMSPRTAPVTLTPTATDVRAAAERMAPYARRTPVMPTEVDGRPVTLKLEQLQLTGAFKLRGALNALLGGSRTDRVITASGGNHGLGVATAARLIGVHAIVYVPETVPEAKAGPL